MVGKIFGGLVATLMVEKVGMAVAIVEVETSNNRDNHNNLLGNKVHQLYLLFIVLVFWFSCFWPCSAKLAV